jgi:hypothetical protein
MSPQTEGGHLITNFPQSMLLVCKYMVAEGIARGVLPVLNAVWLSYDCDTDTFHIQVYTHAQKHISVFIRFRHAHKRNFLPQLKCSRLGNKSWQSDCSNVYGTASSDTVHTPCPKYPSSSMQGKIRRQRNPLFSTKYPRFPGKFRRQKRMHG